MSNYVQQVAERIRGLRLILGISCEEMADVTGVSLQDYVDCEEGRSDFSFTFLYKCANRFGVDIAELVTGDVPKLKFYTVVRKGGGMPIQRRKGFQYQHLAHVLRSRLAEPFLVTAPFDPEDEKKPVAMSTHEGQEIDFVLSGTLKVMLDGHAETLNAGDCVMYDSSHPHGMIAVGGKSCDFLAIVLHRNEEESPDGDAV